MCSVPRHRSADYGRTRRRLASDVGLSDDFGKIPEARWLRAATFERLVRDDSFASEVATTTVGRLGLDRPDSVAIVRAGSTPEKTAEILGAAHERAVAHGAATMIYQLALPFVGFEGRRATPVLPDFAVVARKASDHAAAGDPDGSWLIVGDAKDYERVRSKIDAGCSRGSFRLRSAPNRLRLGPSCRQGWTSTGSASSPIGLFLVPDIRALKRRDFVVLLALKQLTRGLGVRFQCSLFSLVRWCGCLGISRVSL